MTEVEQCTYAVYLGIQLFRNLGEFLHLAISAFSNHNLDVVGQLFELVESTDGVSVSLEQCLCHRRQHILNSYCNSLHLTTTDSMTVYAVGRRKMWCSINYLLLINKKWKDSITRVAPDNDRVAELVLA